MMKKHLKIMAGILTLSMTLQMGAATVLAADAENDPETGEKLGGTAYRYTVTLYAGKQGSFSGESSIEIQKGEGQIAVSGDKSTITVSEVTPNSKIVLEPKKEGAVTLADSAKYYIRGIRESGRDNADALGEQSITVTEDAEYVVAYGVKGQMVKYTVAFEDEDGNRLAPRQTFEGNVGDKPVVAFQYIEGWQPQAYNLTKTLVEDESQNVFTFVYREVPVGQETPVPPAAGAGEAAGAGGAAGAAGAAGGAAAGADAGAAGAGGAAGGAAAGDQGLVPAEEAQVPQALQDLDEGETPLANTDLSNDGGTLLGSNAVRFGVLGVALAALVGLGIVFFRLKKRDAGGDIDD